MTRILLRKSGLHLSYAIIFDASGAVVWATIPTANATATERDYFRFHRDGGAEFVSSAVTGRSSGRIVVPFTARLTTNEGAFAGVAYAPLSAHALSAALETLVPRTGDIVAVIRTEGDIIAHSDDSERLGDQPRLVQQAINRLGEREEATFRSTGSVTGRQLIASFHRVAASNLIAVSAIDIENELTEADRLQLWASTAAVAVWAVLLALALALQIGMHHRWRMNEIAARQAGRDEIERLISGLPAITFVRTVGQDGDGEQLYRNGDGVAVSGWPKGAFPHSEPWIAYAAPGTDHKGMTKRALAEGQATMDWQLRQPNGGYAWMRSTVRRLSRAEDGTGFVVGYILNVTAEREAEAKAMATARLASLGEMGAGLSHELKQPLTGIMLAAANAQAAIQRGDTEKGLMRIQRVIELAQRSAQIIDHLRRFARGDDRAAPMVPAPVARVVKQALLLVSGSLEDAGVAVTLDLGDPAPVVLCHLVALEQVLVNIISNARDAMMALPPGADRCLSVASRSDGPDWASIIIRDTGGGILPEIQHRLFEPFVTTKGPDRGTGLGLSVSLGLIKAMGGRIVGASEERGACFTVTLAKASAEH